MTSVDALQAALERVAGPLESARPRFDLESVPMVAPTTIAQTAEILRLAARERLRVIPFGLGSKLAWCGAPGHVDFMLSTRKLTRVVGHVPDDGTITVEAGMTMADLQQRCRDGGHFLTPDVALPATKSLGGVIAAGESGADRLRFGPSRHHLLGLTVVLADGTIAKSGGQLVKNVTGFDLHRLHCGAHGTLAVIVQASLRLFPEPEHEAWITARAGDASGALALARRALATPARIVSLSLAALDPAIGASRWGLFARVFGKREPVDEEVRLLCEALPSADVVTGADARAAADEMRDRSSFADDAGPVLRVTSRVSRCERALSTMLELLDAARLRRRVAVQPGVAEIGIEIAQPELDTTRLVELVASARAALAPLDAQLELRNAPREALLSLAPFAGPPAGLELMRALQRKLDPDGVFVTGRFHAGL